MKIKDITLKNFGKYDLVSASFDPNVTYLMGPNGAGKSTFGFTGIQFMFEGMAEKASRGNSPVIGERFRFIGPNGKSSGGEMTLYDEVTKQEIKVSRTMTKDGNTVKFEGPATMRLSQEWLTSLFNEFMIAPKKFIQLSGYEQAKALGIDTTTFDANIKALKDEYTITNREMTAMGVIEAVEEVNFIDLDQLSAEKEAERIRLNTLFLENKRKNDELRTGYQEAKKTWEIKLAAHKAEIDTCTKIWQDAYDHMSHFLSLLGIDESDEKQGSVVHIMKTALDEYYSTIKKQLTPEQISKHEPKEPEYIEERPDSSTLDAIDEKILNASKNNVKAEQYQAYLKQLNKKEDLERQLKENKAQQETQVQNRIQYIKEFSFPFDNLTVDETGGLLFDNRPIKEPYFSTGELIKMVPLLFASLQTPLKCVFIQDFNLLDADNQEQVETYLTDAGFQLIIEYVGVEERPGKHCIVLSKNSITEQN